MRSILATLALGFGLVAASAVPTLACAFHDQQASTGAQQQTADAQQQQTTTKTQ